MHNKALKILIFLILSFTFFTLMTACTEKVEYIFPGENQQVLEKEATNDVAAPRSNPRDFQAGVAVLLYGNDDDFEKKTKKLLDRLALINVNSVNLAFPIFQDNWNSSSLQLDEKLTPTDENIRYFIREAHKRKFTVMIRPTIDELSLIPDNKWRGAIQPEDRDSWFKSYSEIILRYTRICEQEGAEIISIGTELSSLEKETVHWRSLIEEIREIYRGQLTYSVNWHNAFDSDIEFWNDLDFISISAFFPLDAPLGATIEKLSLAWEPWINKTKDLKESYGKPVVFTEVGTISQAGSYRSPWRWEHDTPEDLETQNIYYRATCRASKGTVGGLYWWCVDINSLEPKDSNGFNPLGKPAERAIAECFAGKSHK